LLASCCFMTAASFLATCASSLMRITSEFASCSACFCTYQRYLVSMQQIHSCPTGDCCRKGGPASSLAMLASSLMPFTSEFASCGACFCTCSIIMRAIQKSSGTNSQWQVMNNPWPCVFQALCAFAQRLPPGTSIKGHFAQRRTAAIPEASAA